MSPGARLCASAGFQCTASTAGGIHTVCVIKGGDSAAAGARALPADTGFASEGPCFAAQALAQSVDVLRDKRGVLPVAPTCVPCAARKPP